MALIKQKKLNDPSLKLATDPTPDMLVTVTDKTTGKTKTTDLQNAVKNSGISLSSGIIGQANKDTVPDDSTNKFLKYSIPDDEDHIGTYPNFLDAAGNPLKVIADDPENGIIGDLALGVVEFWGQNGVWKKNITKIPLYGLAKSGGSDQTVQDVVNKINSNTLISSKYKDVTGNKVPGKIYTNDGHWDNNTSYERATPVFYKKGTALYLTLACKGSESMSADNTGVCGYANSTDLSSFISTLDSYGKPIGALWDNDRAFILNGTPYPAPGDYNYNVYVRQKIVLPQDMWVRPSSYSGPGSTSATPLVIEVEDYENDTLKIKDLAQQNAENIEKTRKYFKNQNLNLIYDGQSVNALNGQLISDASLDGYHNEPCSVRQNEDEEVIIKWSGVIRGNDTESPTVHIGLMGLGADGNFVSTPDSKGRPIGELFSWGRYMDLPQSERPSYTSRTGPNGTYTFDNVILKLPKEIWAVVGGGYKSQTVSELLIDDCPLTIGIIGINDSLAQEVENLKNEKVDGTSIYMDKMAAIAVSYSKRKGAFNAPLKNFTFLHVSDSHYFSTKSRDNMAEMLEFAKHPDVAPLVDSVICTGDICNGLHGRDKSLAVDEINAFMVDFLKFSTLPNVRLQQIRGNHDDGVSPVRGGENLDNLIDNVEEYNLMFRPLADKYPEIKAVANTAYHYTDYDNYKIRVIGLDCYDLPRTPDENGNLKYSQGVVGNYYSQDQLTWFYNTLKSVPAGYHVMILSHGSMIQGQDFYNYMQGWDVITKMLDAYMNGKSYIHSYTNQYYPELNTYLEVDFAPEGGRPVIGIFSGHIHAPLVVKNPDYPGLNHISIPCGKMDSGSDLWSNGCYRCDTDESRNAFGIGQVNIYERRFTYTIYGQFRDASGVLRDQTSFIEY